MNDTSGQELWNKLLFFCFNHSSMNLSILLGLLVNNQFAIWKTKLFQRRFVLINFGIDETEKNYGCKESDNSIQKKISHWILSLRDWSNLSNKFVSLRNYQFKHFAEKFKVVKKALKIFNKVCHSICFS
jgi:hypothetical protein